MTTITALPDPPDRGDPTNFRTRADDFLGALPTLVTEINTVAGEINTASAAAVTAQAAAEIAAADAQAAADVTKWISGTTYAQGVCVWSPADYQTYRRKVAGAGTTDPSADATNWARILSRSAPWTTLTASGTLTTNSNNRYATTGQTYTLPATANLADGDEVLLVNTGSDLTNIAAANSGQTIVGVASRTLDAPVVRLKWCAGLTDWRAV
jgi:hypothetical protein